MKTLVVPLLQLNRPVSNSIPIRQISTLISKLSEIKRWYQKSSFWATQSAGDHSDQCHSTRFSNR